MTLNTADEKFVTGLASLLPDDTIRHPEDRYLEEPRGRWKGKAGALALPRTVEEVSTIVRVANEAEVGVVPYGGGTGLVGGQTLSEGPAPLLLSLERMNKIRDVHTSENVIVAEAGAILADVQAAAAKADRLFPLSLAAEGSAQIGGNLATNAGGVNVLRYGNARALCLGLEAVLPNGEIWHGLSRLRKDNTGYDLRNLLIGAEGSLGVITAASLTLAPRPMSSATAIMVVPSPTAAIELLALVRDHVAEGISAFELLHMQSYYFLAEALPDLRLPFAQAPEWSVLIDLGMSKSVSADVAMTEIFAEAMVKNLVTDGVVAQSESQAQVLWSLREHIPVANRKIGSISSHDISVPISLIPKFIERGKAEIAQIDPKLRINCFGHLGDGNLHYNVFPPKGQSRDSYDSIRARVKTCVHALTHSFGGSVSAEHGVGRLKTTDLEDYGDPVKLSAMRAIKRALDPKCIMNPGVIMPYADVRGAGKPNIDD